MQTNKRTKEQLLESLSFNDLLAELEKRGAKIPFRSSEESNCLMNTEFTKINFEHIIITDSKFINTDFNQTLFEHVKFENCNFHNTDFNGATVHKVAFNDCTYHNVNTGSMSWLDDKGKTNDSK